jgi:hypothetical protein
MQIVHVLGDPFIMMEMISQVSLLCCILAQEKVGMILMTLTSMNKGRLIISQLPCGHIFSDWKTP